MMDFKEDKMADTLGDRIKAYEDVSRNYLTRKVPVIVRIDGRAFHTFTRGLEKPFCKSLTDTLKYAALNTAKEISGCEAVYLQSDEISFLLTDYKELETQPWFDYNLSKILSISASLFTYYFNNEWKKIHEDKFKDVKWESTLNKYNVPKEPKMATFDSRAFNVPKEDVLNVFLWRMKDWERNSLTMYASSFFSHKQLMGKNKENKHEMLHGIDKNWTTDLSDVEKNGTFYIKNDLGEWVERCDILPHYDDLKKAFQDSKNPCLTCLE